MLSVCPYAGVRSNIMPFFFPIFSKNADMKCKAVNSLVWPSFGKKKNKKRFFSYLFIWSSAIWWVCDWRIKMMEDPGQMRFYLWFVSKPTFSLVLSSFLAVSLSVDDLCLSEKGGGAASEEYCLLDRTFLISPSPPGFSDHVHQQHFTRTSIYFSLSYDQFLLALLWAIRLVRIQVYEMDLGFFFFFFINVATKRRVHDRTLRGKCSTFFFYFCVCVIWYEGGCGL